MFLLLIIFIGASLGILIEGLEKSMDLLLVIFIGTALGILLDYYLIYIKDDKNNRKEENEK